MSMPRSAFIDYLVYLFVRVLVAVIQLLPYRTGCQFAAGLAWLAYHIDRRHRLVAVENLGHAFPGRYREAELDALVRAVYRHFCTLIIDIIQLPRKLQPGNWRQHVHIDEPRWSRLLLSGRPLLVVTGHFGNWEMGGYALGLLGVPSYAVARELDNRFLDDYLRRFRESTGQKLLAKKGDFDQMESILANGGVLATLGDQDAGQRGLFVDFFGRPASTHKAIALLALEHGVPAAVVGVAKVGSNPLRYEAIIEDVILPEEYAGKPDAVRAMTQRFTTALERLVRRYPEQYFWLHRRWKHQPKPRKGQRAA